MSNPANHPDCCEPSDEEKALMKRIATLKPQEEPVSCEACNAAQKEAQLYMYRWKNATVMIMGCREHVREIFEVLTKAQVEPKE